MTAPDDQPTGTTAAIAVAAIISLIVVVCILVAGYYLVNYLNRLQGPF
jgi:hypothetical protein